MKDLKEIFQFGWPYMRPYWFRLVVGIVLGIFFGASNAGFVWGINTLIKRMAPPLYDAEGKYLLPSQPGIRPGKIYHWTRGNADHQLINGAQILSDSEHYFIAQTNTVTFVGEPTQAVLASVSSGKGRGNQIIETFNQAVDPWLPLKNRKIDWKQLVGGFLLLPIMVAFRGYVGYLSSYCMAWVSERVVRDLRLDLLKKLNSLSMDYFNRATMGELLGRVNGDTMALYRCLSLGLSDLIKEPVTIIACLAAIFWIDWKLTLLAIIFTPLSVVPMRVVGKKIKAILTSGVTVGIQQDSLLVEVYSSIRIIKAFCLEEMQIRRFRQIYDNLVRIGMKSVQARELVNPIVETISMCGLGLVIIFIFKTGVTIENLVAFLMGVVAMYTPIRKLGGLHIYIQTASVGANRLVEIFKQEPSVKEKPDAVALPHFQRELRLENVNFSYGAKPVLKNLSLTIPRGMKLGIAGESGSGKSTLVNLIFRFYDPTKGRIVVDGHDMRDLRVFDLRQQMALVSQEVVIFDQTVTENIACGKEGATQAEVEAAARGAYAHDFIMHLPQGYATRLGERGVTLSVGQRQRLSIARAFIRDAPILVLDEATASLDSIAEAEVQVAIDHLSEHRTVICIAHRLSTLASTDLILVLSQGEVVEQGSFQELLALDGTFATMARRQGISSASHKLGRIGA